jgi:hypothetical protein
MKIESDYAESSEILQDILKRIGSPVGLGFLDDISSDFFRNKIKRKIHE